MATKLYFLNDTTEHLVNSEDFQEICDMPLGFEPTYLVIATVDFDREDLGSDGKRILFQVRLEVLSGFGAPVASDHQQFTLSAVVGTVNFDHFDRGSVNFDYYDRTPSSRHASLMVAATVPAEGAGRDTSLPFTLGETETSAEALIVPPPRAILSARGYGILGQRSGVVLSKVRIVAFQADEVVLKHL